MTILDLIGNMPLLSLDIDGLKEGVKLFAKAEFMNVGGSVKDRAAKAMLTKGIEGGILTWDKTVIDATSGNTGIPNNVRYKGKSGKDQKLCTFGGVYAVFGRKNNYKQ